jgi:hypothetical protein
VKLLVDIAFNAEAKTMKFISTAFLLFFLLDVQHHRNEQYLHIAVLKH